MALLKRKAHLFECHVDVHVTVQQPPVVFLSRGRMRALKDTTNDASDRPAGSKNEGQRSK